MEQTYGIGGGDHYIRAEKKETSYLIPLDRVEIIKAGPTILPVPGAPSGILGIAWHDNRLIPFLRLEGWETPGTVPCGILLRLGDGRIVGIAADGIGETSKAGEEELKEQEEFLRFLAEGI